MERERHENRVVSPAIRYSQIADHLPALLADIASVFILLEETGGAPTRILTDGSDFQRLLGDHRLERATSILRNVIAQVEAASLAALTRSQLEMPEIAEAGS